MQQMQKEMDKLRENWDLERMEIIKKLKLCEEERDKVGGINLRLL